MNTKITRRDFLKKTTQAGIVSTLGGATLSHIFQGSGLSASDAVDIAVAKGSDYLESTRKAVETLGGISKFVSKSSKVAILPNS